MNFKFYNIIAIINSTQSFFFIRIMQGIRKYGSILLESIIAQKTFFLVSILLSNPIDGWKENAARKFSARSAPIAKRTRSRAWNIWLLAPALKRGANGKADSTRAPLRRY